MPGFLTRFTTLIKAKISALLDRAEDPSEILDYGYQRQLESLQEVRRGIADVVTAKKRMQMQEERLRAAAAKLDGQARQALVAGQDDLARTALERKQAALSEVDSFTQQVAELEAQQERLV